MKQFKPYNEAGAAGTVTVHVDSKDIQLARMRLREKIMKMKMSI